MTFRVLRNERDEDSRTNNSWFGEKCSTKKQQNRQAREERERERKGREKKNESLGKKSKPIEPSWAGLKIGWARERQRERKKDGATRCGGAVTTSD